VTVALVGAGPGAPGLLTLRGAELLRQAEVVVHDRLVSPEVLAMAPTGALVIDAAELSTEPDRQPAITALLLEHGRAGRRVVRLKGGDPFLFGRGGEEAEALRQAGIPCEVVPGVSSALAAPASAGIPVTHRGLAASVTVVTAQLAAGTGLPEVDWESIGRTEGTLVVLMGMSARAAIADALIRAGRPGDTPVAVVHWATTPAEQEVRTTLAELADVALPSPAVIVIGAVADLDVGSSTVESDRAD
jgi:uroporphyrin-III C-methyltransferase